MSKSQRDIVNNQDGFLFAAISYIFKAGALATSLMPGSYFRISSNDMSEEMLEGRFKSCAPSTFATPVPTRPASGLIDRSLCCVITHDALSTKNTLTLSTTGGSWSFKKACIATQGCASLYNH